MIEQVRKRKPREPAQPRELLIVCAPLRSNVNLSMIARTAGCCGVPKIIAAGRGTVDARIARDAASAVEIEVRSSLPPVVERLRKQGYSLVGLEQTTASVDIHHFHFPRRTALVVGNERAGIPDRVVEMLDACVEIPVWGLPHSYNVATATSMALYEYCRQYPD
jgi:tRNA G18 (ribose-2'-O)-methylase SpoU